MVRFVEIAREGGVKLLYDMETLKEYPLTIETAINIANHLNDEILEYEKFGAFDKDGKFKGYKKDVDVKLLEKIRHDLVSLGGLHATDLIVPATGYVNLNVDDLVDLDFTELIKEIDEVLE